MKFIFLLISLFIFITNCGSMPIDSTPSWDSSSRFALEMQSDCSSTPHTLGLSGCAMRASQLQGNIIFPALYYGQISMISSNCKNYSIAAGATDSVVALKDLYNAQNKQSCSWEILRNIQSPPQQFPDTINPFGDKTITSDNMLLGRFFLKILPESPYISTLAFSVGDNTYSGIGFFQRLIGKQDAILTIQPKSKSGMFSITCGEGGTPAVVYHQPYTSSPFTIALNSNINCDYEMMAVNAEPTGDGSDFETATYVHHVSTAPTVDITVPAVSKSGTNISFSFNDMDASGKNPVVYAVQIGNSTFIETNKGTVINNQGSYIVKGLTPSLRFFYGVYSMATQSWRVE